MLRFAISSASLHRFSETLHDNLQRDGFEHFWNWFGKNKSALEVTFARKYHIGPASSPWVSENDFDTNTVISDHFARPSRWRRKLNSHFIRENK